MSEKSWKKCVLFFDGICWSTTVTVIFYWIYIFSQNEDLCIVDYKKYYQDKTDVFPVLSLCFRNPFSNKKLGMSSAGINDTSYLEFLEGKYFSPEMLAIDYKNITMDMSEYLVRYWVNWRNGSYETKSLENKNDKKIFISTYAGFRLDGHYKFYNCYGMQMPSDKQMSAFYVQLRNTIFPSSTGPTSYDFFTLLHYPNQLLISMKSVKYTWPKHQTNNTYETKFTINLVEVIRRRNKDNRPCDEEWGNHDDNLLVKHTNNAGCRAPYQDPSVTIRNCSNTYEMKQARFKLRKDDYGAFPPCKAMEKIIYTYEETDLSSTEWEGKGNFWVGIHFIDQNFKEIVQTRAIDLQALVGNVGGYIGLCLGYSLLQLPDLILWISRKTKKYYENKRSRSDNTVPFPLEETQFANGSHSKGNSEEQGIYKALYFVQIEQTKMAQRIDILTEFMNKMNEKGNEVTGNTNET